MTRALKSLAVGGCWVVATAVPVAATHSLGPMPVVPLISAEYVKERLVVREQLVLVDLRRPEEYEAGRLPQAWSIPLYELRARYTEIPRAGLAILYCACRPGEDWHAYEVLHVRGYRNVVLLAGGFSGWVERGYPLEGADRDTTRR